MLLLVVRGLPAATCRVVVGEEHRLQGLLEQRSDLERQRQAGVAAAGLDGVHGLPGHVEAVGQVRLAPPSDLRAFRAADSSPGPPIGHRQRHRPGDESADERDLQPSSAAAGWHSCIAEVPS